MFIDARSLSFGQRIEADICIVGAGAAGITLALELAGSGRRVLLAESGEFRPDERTQDLYDGESAGLAYRVRESRNRLFGGTTNAWGGACRPLDVIDFSERQWIAHSGWPFAQSELLPYYRRARDLFDLDPTEPHNAPAPWNHPFEAALWEGSPPTRFGVKYRDALGKAADVTVLLNANLVGLAAAPSGAAVTQAEFAAIGGPRFAIAARRYVLACGGLENARMLLIASRAAPGSFANRTDLVGRFLMEHWSIQLGFLVHKDASTLAARYFFVGGGHGLRLTDAAQEEHQIAGAGLYPYGPLQVSDLPVLEASLGAGIRGFISKLFDGSAFRQRPVMRVNIAFEQAPDPSNRVVLGDDLDELGLPRLRLDWRLGEGDRRTLATAAKLLVREAARQRMGKLCVRPPFLGIDFRRPDGIIFDLPRGSDLERAPYWPDTELTPASHHMGTTRMHRDARQGVVDPEGRVHGLENLFLAGSSVFPTGGISNPTFTIVALALRLADRLRAEP